LGIIDLHDKITFGWENIIILSNNIRNWYMYNTRFIQCKLKMLDVIYN